jgi:purine catabolism regulator
MLQRGVEQSLAARHRGEFIAGLMGAGAPVDERDATAMAAELGFDRRALLRLPLVAVTRYRWSLDGEQSSRSGWPGVWSELMRELESMRMSAVAGILPREGLSLVVALRSPEDRDGVADRISRMLRRAAQISAPGTELVICVGALSRSWAQVGSELREALELSHAIAHGPRQEWFDASSARIERLLWALRNDEALQGFLSRRLERIADHDREHGTHFVSTVESYCAHGGRIAETARDLHLQRQSLYKRIGRIEELLGEALSDPDTRLGLHLAIRMRRYLAALQSAGET